LPHDNGAVRRRLSQYHRIVKVGSDETGERRRKATRPHSTALGFWFLKKKTRPNNRASGVYLK
jgi:hypothetical protein